MMFTCQRFILIISCYDIYTDLIIDIVPSSGQLNTTEGDNLTITVEVLGIPISTTWTFGHNGLRVANSEKYLIQEDFPVVSLTILDVREDDAGTYFLTVSGNSESVTGQYDVEVQGQLCRDVPCLLMT